MLKHTALFLGHELRRSAANPVWPLFGLLQPILYLLFFSPLVANTTPGQSRSAALQEFAPGVMVMVALFGSLFVGFGVIAEIRSGVLERLAAGPVSRPAIILGRVGRDVIVLEIQLLLLLMVAILMGLRPDGAGLLVALVLMAVVGALASGISYAVALSVRQENAMSQILQFFALPLILFTGILLPMSLAPSWMRAVAEVNPFYHTVEAGRALFRGDFSAGSIPLAFVLGAGFAVLTVAWAVRCLQSIAD
jgi:ABC-2 type transport system permease protein